MKEYLVRTFNISTILHAPMQIIFGFMLQTGVADYFIYQAFQSITSVFIYYRIIVSVCYNR